MVPQPVRGPAGRKPLTISRLARSFGLARSTLLHYHRIGLLKPTGHSRTGYRLYGPEAYATLARIVELRTAGLPLHTIKRVLQSQAPLSEVLEKQIRELNAQIGRLRAQQRVVLSLLQAPMMRSQSVVLSKEIWTRMFRSIGMSDADMHAWHADFERTMPQAHQDFLESLGLDAKEVKRIREWSARAPAA